MFFRYHVKMNLKYSEIFKIATILGFRCVFKPEVIMEVESNNNKGHAIPYILRFCSKF